MIDKKNIVIHSDSEEISEDHEDQNNLINEKQVEENDEEKPNKNKLNKQMLKKKQTNKNSTKQMKISKALKKQIHVMKCLIT